MAVYVDPLLPCLTSKAWRYTHSSHLIGDTEEELIAFAERIGLKAEWIQRGTSITHFDLNSSKRQQAVEAGAIEIDIKEMGKRIQKHRQYLRKRKRSYAS